MSKYIDLIESGVIAMMAIFAPIKSMLLVSLIFIFVDLISGVLAARKRGEPITSAGIRRTLSKIFVYEVSLCVAYLAQTYMMQDIPMVKILSALITSIELKSILENMDTINESSLLRTLVDSLGSSNQIK